MLGSRSLIRLSKSIFKSVLIFMLTYAISACTTIPVDVRDESNVSLEISKIVYCEYQGVRTLQDKIKYARLLLIDDKKSYHGLYIPLAKAPYLKSLWAKPGKEGGQTSKPVQVIYNPAVEKGIRQMTDLLPPESWEKYPSKLVIYKPDNEKRIYLAYRTGPRDQDIYWSMADGLKEEVTELYPAPLVPILMAGAYIKADMNRGKNIRFGAVNSVAFSPDGNYALSGSSDSLIRLWDIKTGQLIRIFKGHTKLIHSVAFSPDGKNVLSGSADRTVKLWETDSGRLLGTHGSHAANVKSVAFSPDGKYILSGSYDGTMKLWDVSAWKEVKRFRDTSTKTFSISAIAFSPNGDHILSASNYAKVILWDVKSGQPIKTMYGHTDLIETAAFDPKGKYALSGGIDWKMKLWELESGWEIKSIQGHANYFYSVAFTPDGRRILSGNRDNKLRLWDAQSGILVRTLEEHDDNAVVYSVAVSPDGCCALSGSNDETMKLWNLETGKIIRSFKDATGDGKDK